ncbi:MAG: response regulator [Leptolyngbyaceae cyanobacterium SM1_1_3]|nr:response regulator [Leptolyngbyaceae cyanobacterium SM1_1_3]NJN01110.1 response regulator [Leptolyngbyaceae cyanobacterium RM1_1_2]NJO10774.1 response regulator [Leptolyngbyaceae cyanobacterium SL_1_1]
MFIILSLARNPHNQALLAALLEPLGYRLLLTQSHHAFEQMLRHSPVVNFALVDISGFDQQVWNCCDRLRQRRIIFFVLAPKSNPKISHTSSLHGASGCLGKPLNRQNLVQLVQYHCLPKQ